MTSPISDDAALTIDRRKFLGSVGLAAGAAVAASVLPLSLQASEASPVVAEPDADGLWSIDVMCGHWPPYSHPIPYGRPAVAEAFAGVAPEDLMFVV